MFSLFDDHCDRKPGEPEVPASGHGLLETAETEGPRQDWLMSNKLNQIRGQKHLGRTRHKLKLHENHWLNCHTFISFKLFAQFWTNVCIDGFAYNQGLVGTKAIQLFSLQHTLILYKLFCEGSMWFKYKQYTKDTTAQNLLGPLNLPNLSVLSPSLATWQNRRLKLERVHSNFGKDTQS